jgi:PAS domain S-box-containing protein
MLNLVRKLEPRRAMTTTETTDSLSLERALQAPQFPVGIFWTDRKGFCTRVNTRWCELSGLSVAESLGHGWVTALHPEDRARVAMEQARHLSSGKPLSIEFRLLQPSGDVVWVLSQAVPSYDPSGRLEGIVGTITDITDRVGAHEALRESEQRFRNLVELAPDFVAIHRAGVMLYVNESGLRLLRARDESELVGHHILDFVLPEHRALAVERMRELQQGKSIPIAEMRVRRCDGELIWIETVASPTVWEGEPATQLVARDVTERRKTEEAYRVVVENVRDAMWVMERAADGEWRATFVNETYLRYSHLPSADIILNKTFAVLVDEGMIEEEAAARSMLRYDEAARSDGPSEYENRLKWNGIEAEIVTTMTPVRDSEGACNRLICWSRDVSRRRLQERALAESEANYRAVVEGTSDAVWVMDRGADDVYRVRMANQNCARLLGLVPEEVIGQPLEAFLSPAAAKRANERYLEAEARGEPIEYETPMDRPAFRGQVVTHLTPLLDANGRCYRIIGSARDVSDRRRAEAALLQAQKLESLGVLAGGVAHDFNNLLTTILGNLYLLETELPAESPLREYIGESRVAGERGAELVRRLLGFSRPAVPRNEEVSLESLIAETTTLVQRTLGPSVAVSVEHSSLDDRVAGEFTALQQVLVNLLFSARDAMPEGGRITIRRRQLRLSANVWRERGLAPGRYHQVEVHDEGTGMSAEVQRRIFDPFFTTKEVGKGTGLGLSTAFSIARAHRGWLEAQSVDGEGSTFRLILPAM